MSDPFAGTRAQLAISKADLEKIMPVLRKQHSESGSLTDFEVLTMTSRDEYIAAAKQVGASWRVL